jgi:serine/threonine protein kinase
MAIPDDIHHDYKVAFDFLEELLVLDYRQRKMAKDLLQHEFLASVDRKPDP